MHQDGCGGCADALKVRLRGFFCARGCVIYKGDGCSFMQTRRPPRIRCSSVWVYLLFYFLFYILSFTFFLPTPNPLPSGKRALSLRSLAFLPSLLSTQTYCLQAHPLRWMGHFLLGLFKERAVAMGKPHCNLSISTFWFCTQ